MIKLRDALLCADELYAARGLSPSELIFWCGAKVVYEIMTSPNAQPLSFTEALRCYGMEVLEDRWIESDAWQITDRDHTLLWDSRMEGGR